jgi:phospho-N-acetylmuramoyl-pentapeptide-transferase
LVKTIIVSGVVAMLAALAGTPLLIRLLRSKGYGQPIRVDGPQSHQTKRGTPTMGGSVFVVASLIGYLVGHAVTGEPLTT